MTLNILTPATITKPDQYHLPEIHRKAILAQSDSSRLRLEIERQRLEFIRCHGDAFGVNRVDQDEQSPCSASSSS